MTDVPQPVASNLAPGESRPGAILDQIRPLWKHRYLVLAIAAATTALVALWTLRQPKIYSAMVTIEFDPTPPRPLGNQVEDVSAGVESFWASREYYITQYRVIQSERVAEGVVRQLGLNHDADFLGVRPNARSSFRSVSVSAAAAVLLGRMKVEPVKESRLVTIAVEDPSARRAQLITNTIAAVYIRQNLEQKLSTTVSALEWLGQQLETLRSQLEASEMALHEYRLHNNLLSVSFEDTRNTLGNRISALSTSLTEIMTRRITVTAKVAELRRASLSDDPLVQQAPELLSSGALQGLRGHYEEARRERDALATRYGNNSAQMMSVNSRMSELSDAIRHEVRNILGAAEAELRQIRRVESDLQAAAAESQREGLELNLREIEYGRLQRQRENNSKLYGIVLERTKETDLTRMLRVNNIRVLDDALMPGGPVKPKVPLNIAMGALGGLLLGLMTAFMLVQADRSVRSQADIEDELHATFLGIVPRIDTKPQKRGYAYGYSYVDPSTPTKTSAVTNIDLVVHSHPNSPAAEACRVIRTNLLFMSPDQPFQALMVASADPREGKTTVAISIAIILAQSGKRTLLIDTDLRRPRVSKAFGLRPPVGVTSVLVNDATLEEAILDTEIPNLSLLPCGPIPPNPAEILHSQRFQELVKQVRGKYDRVIFDTPPIGPVTDALIIGPQVDGTVLVARARKTHRARAAAMLAQLRSLGGRVAGVVLNDVDTTGGGGSNYYYAGGSYNYRPQPQNEVA